MSELLKDLTIFISSRFLVYTSRSVHTLILPTTLDACTDSISLANLAHALKMILYSHTWGDTVAEAL